MANTFTKHFAKQSLLKTLFRMSKDRSISDSDWTSMDKYLTALMNELKLDDPDMDTIKRNISKLGQYWAKMPANIAADLASTESTIQGSATGGGSPYAGYRADGSRMSRNRSVFSKRLASQLAELKSMVRGTNASDEEVAEAMLRGLVQGIGDPAAIIEQRESEAKREGRVLDVTSDGKRIADAKFASKVLADRLGIL